MLSKCCLFHRSPHSAKQQKEVFKSFSGLPTLSVDSFDSDADKPPSSRKMLSSRMRGDSAPVKVSHAYLRAVFLYGDTVCTILPLKSSL